MIYIGIDPGVSGGFAAIGFHGEVIEAFKMPATERDILDKLCILAQVGEVPRELNPPGQMHAILERVGASPQMGTVSAFTFGRVYGRLEMALVGAGIPHDIVAPAVWQRAMGCLSRGDKNITKRRAQQIFPKLTITHATADALLMAEYCRRLHTRSHGKEESEPQQTREGSQASKGEAHAPHGPAPRHGATEERQTRNTRRARV